MEWAKLIRFFIGKTKLRKFENRLKKKCFLFRGKESLFLPFLLNYCGKGKSDAFCGP